MTYIYPESASTPFKIDLGFAADRTAQIESKPVLPQDFQVASADCHWEITEDIFYENFPPSLRDRAPRVWFDRYWRIGFQDGQQAFKPSERLTSVLERILVQDAFDEGVRYSDMDKEGIHSEIVFPQSLLGMLRVKDLEVREQMWRTYNEYIARSCAKGGSRSHGVGIFANWWDPAKAESSMQQIVDLGLKTFMIPVMLKDPNGNEVSFGSDEMKRFWSVVEASGLPLNFHVGEDPVFDGPPGTHATYSMHSFSPFRRPLSQIVFGRVFDRHPNLRIVFTEAGINWAAGFIQDAELYYGTWGSAVEDKPTHNPTHYWHTHCYATFQYDKLGLELLPYIGADRVMWGSDYPHSEGTFGAGWDAIKDVLARTSEADARKILGDTARQVFKF